MCAFIRPTFTALACTLALALAGCPDSSTKPPEPPDAPASLTATPFYGAVMLEWSGSAGATSYRVYQSATAGQQPAAMTLLASGVTGTTFNAAAPNGSLLYYRVTAVSSGGESAASPEASATALATLAPAPPAGVTATPGNRSVTLAWDDVPSATSYTVYWSNTAGVTTGDASFACATSPCTHTTLTNGTTYFYAVTALIGANASALSAEVAATPAALPYIDATAMWMPGLGNQYQVQVCADAACNTPISNASVSIAGTALAYDGVDTYEAMPSGSLAGASLELVVTIPPGAGVVSGTYRATGTMYSTAPMLTNPTAGATWQASQTNVMSWTAGAPTAGSSYSYMLLNMGSFMSSVIGFIPGAGTTSATISANTLVAGSHMAFVAIGPMAAIPIPNTLAGSGFLISASSPYVTFTVQ